MVAIPTVQFVTLYRVALLSAMMANLQYDLRQLIVKFVKSTTDPRVEFPYTYLMA